MKKEHWILLFILLSLFTFTGPVFAEKVRTLTEVLHPFRFYVDEEQLYITEGVKVFIYSKKDYRLVKKFGKEGEGPGEVLLRRRGGNTEIGLIVQKEHIIVSTVGKLIYFTKDGNFVKEIKTAPAGRWLSPFGELFVGKKYIREKDGLYHGIALYDSNIKQLKLIYKHIHGWQGTEAEFNPLIVEQADFEIGGDKIFVMDGARTMIGCFDKTGQPLFSITIKDEIVEFTEEDKKNMVADYKTNAFWKRYYETRKHFFKFPEYFPPISMFTLDPVEKKIYIKTEKKENGKQKWAVYDFNGKLIKTTLLPLGWLRFYNGICYRLLLNEEEDEWELYVGG